ncbi:MAG TPA: DUF1214 domain-containing protein [Steroidobacteraceae bacterium]
MAFGDSPHDQDLRQAWHAFCDRLKSSGDLVFKNSNPPSSLQRADGFRYLTQNLSQAFDLALETKDARYPSIHAFCSPVRKLGSDNADCMYLQAWIDGQSSYKVSGRKGTARFWNMTIQGPRVEGALHDPFGDTPEANLFGHELVANWDGSFEVYVGGPPQGQNWLPTTAGTRKIYFRQYFDRWDEVPASYIIERIDMHTPRPAPDHRTMITAMQWAADFVYNVVDYWPDHLWKKGELIDPAAINRFNARNLVRTPWSAGEEEQDVRRGRFFTQMRWSLEEDQALIIEFPANDDFWMLTNEGMFGNSMDFTYRHVSYTPSRTAVDADGKIRFVVAQEDPGYANWVETQGYASGIISFRNVLTRNVPELTTKLVKTAALSGLMPPASKTVTSEERIRLLRERFHAIKRRYPV